MDSSAIAREWARSDHKRRAAYVEWMTEQAIREFIGEGDTALDLGANYGAHTMTMLKQVGKTGRVYAVEANPTIAQHLSRWSESFPLIVLQVALSDYEGESSFFIAEDSGFSSLDSSSIEAHRQKIRTEIRCEVRKLDTILADLSERKVAFVKLDVEGAELAVLRGGSATLLSHLPMMVMECRLGSIVERDPVAFKAFSDAYLAAGYRVFSLLGGDVTDSIPLDEYQFVLLPPADETLAAQIGTWLSEKSGAFFSDESLSRWTPYQKFERR